MRPDLSLITRSSLDFSKCSHFWAPIWNLAEISSKCLLSSHYGVCKRSVTLLTHFLHKLMKHKYIMRRKSNSWLIPCSDWQIQLIRVRLAKSTKISSSDPDDRSLHLVLSLETITCHVLGHFTANDNSANFMSKLRAIHPCVIPALPRGTTHPTILLNAP